MSLSFCVGCEDASSPELEKSASFHFQTLLYGLSSMLLMQFPYFRDSHAAMLKRTLIYELCQYL